MGILVLILFLYVFFKYQDKIDKILGIKKYPELDVEAIKKFYAPKSVIRQKNTNDEWDNYPPRSK